MNKAVSETYVTDVDYPIGGTDGLVNRLRQASRFVYLACDERVADDLSKLMSDAAEWINAQGAEMAKACDRLAYLEDTFNYLNRLVDELHKLD